jgi:SAM-dependent methyltransferase
MAVAEWLIVHGLTEFSIDCYELSPHLLQRAAGAAKEKNLAKHLRMIESDLNQASFSRCYDGAMAHHSLHHIVALEHVFEQVRSHLEPHGVFAISDMIGRNGHMRWPEALDVVQALWRLLPEAKRYNHQSQRMEKEYINHDCSVEGFEGIRAQDILPLLLQFFRPRTFLGYGCLTDIFVDRAFGHNFSPSDAWDMNFIDLVQMLNERMIDGGIVKPTTMLALFDLTSPASAYYRSWSPAFCVRPAI